MIKSMTGFGSARTDLPTGAQLCCDIRTLNHKYLDVAISLGRTLKAYEAPILRQAKATFHRGRVEITLSIETAETGEVPGISRQKARAYVQQLEALKKELSLAGEIDISLIAGIRDIFTRADISDIPSDTMLDCIRKVVNDAMNKVLEMRTIEGKAIFDDFIMRISHLKDDLARIRNEAQENVPLWRQRIRERVKEFSQDISVNENRMEQEILFHALKSDITEECIRLENHITQFEQIISAEEVCGKKLAFLLHEMIREVNTLSVKAISPSIIKRAVSLRDEVENLREQTYNIE